MFHVVIEKANKSKTSTHSYKFKSEQAAESFVCKYGLSERVIDKFWWA